MRVPFIPALLLALVAHAPGAMAHHPGEDLDELMGSEEQFFQAIDESAPPFELVNVEGYPVRLSDFADKIVVLDQGAIREIGRHEDLVNHGGIYQRLHNLQFIEFDAVVDQ